MAWQFRFGHHRDDNLRKTRPLAAHGQVDTFTEENERAAGADAGPEGKAQRQSAEA